MTEQGRLCVLEALQAVSIELRAIGVAHDIDGIPIKEIAEQRRMPPSTVYKWRARGLAALKAELERLAALEDVHRGGAQR